MFRKYGGRKYKYNVKRGGGFGSVFSGKLPGIDFIKDLLGSLTIRFHENLLIVKVVAVALVAGFIIMLCVDYYNVRQLAGYQANVSTKIYDKNGLLISELFWQKREIVPFNKIPKELTQAFIAVEDNDFYNHWGINPKGIVRAFFINIASVRIKQGGSTITQQLSKILLTSRKRNIFRKVNEAFIALMIEATYSKNRILELYLNQLFLGHGANGVETASKLYFNKHVWELNTAECALLATLPSSPNNYSPIKYPERSMKLHRQALAKMVDMGYLTIRQAEDAYVKFWPEYLKYINDLPPTMTAASERIDNAPWFTEYIRRKIVEKYGEETVFNKGLIVYTTCDLKKQEAAEKVIRERLKTQSETSFDLAFKKDDVFLEQMTPTIKLFSLLFDFDPVPSKVTLLQKKVNDYYQENILDQFDGLNFIIGTDPVADFAGMYRAEYLHEKEFQNVEGALITINNKNGYIEAIVGGSSFTSSNQLNRAVQARRQSGSAIKPLLYAAAFDTKKLSPASALLDSPIVYFDNDGGDWIPENYDNEYYGMVRLRTALAKSLNVISVRIAEKIGITTIMDYYARLLHFNDTEKKNRIRRDMSIALGSVEVSPYELARAYAIIARGGTDFNPFSIRKITDAKGKVLENQEEEMLAQAAKSSRQVIKPETSQLMLSILQSVMSQGTGLSASIGRPAGGKTGTTNSWKDAWFCGFTPDVTTCVWVGYDKLGMTLGVGQSGGVIAAPIWGDYMRRALEGEPVSGFSTYAALESADVCERSGLKASHFCKSLITEVFAPGTVPEEECTVCEQGDSGSIEGLRRKGPRENIARKQKEQIFKSIEKKKKGSAIDSIGSDLLE